MVRKNHEVAKILYEIADILEIQDVQFKPEAYRKAARNIDAVAKNISDLYREDRLDDIQGVGKSISEKIAEFLKTGKIKYYEKLKKKLPVDIESLSRVEGMGPKNIKKLYKELKIRNLKDLEKAARTGKISKIEGFGKKSEEAILDNIKFAKSSTRMLLGHALPIAESIIDELKKLGEAKQFVYAGSLRRKKETIGDIDILAMSSDPRKIINYFVKMRDVQNSLARGPTKATVRLNSGLQVDIRVLPEEKFGSALLYFTGSKEHNVELRRIAISMKMKLNEYGLFKGKKPIASRTERDIYRKLGMSYIEPELRESSGEITGAKKRKLPKLVKDEDIKGDLHMHSIWSDGTKSIGEMALSAKQLNRKYICITDHTGRLAIAGGLNERQIEKQAKEIEKTNSKISGITVLHGCEANIGKDGKLDLKDSTLKKLDVVIASVHSNFKMNKKEMTKRIINAMENTNVNVIAHPTGRLINKRPGYEVDMEKLLDASKRTNTYLEINSFPNRLDLDDSNIREAVKHKCILSMGSDSHAIEHLEFIKFGVATARRGWAEKKNILTTRTLVQLKKLIDLKNI